MTPEQEFLQQEINDLYEQEQKLRKRRKEITKELQLSLGHAILVIDNEKLIPQEYWVPQPSKPDKYLIWNDLIIGKEIPGTHLESSISIESLDENESP